MVYLIYETDTWHSNESKVLRGAYDSLDAAITAVVENNEFNYDKIAREYELDPDEATKEDIEGIITDELRTYRQTSFDQFNYMIEEAETDTWL